MFSWQCAFFRISGISSIAQFSQLHDRGTQFTLYNIETTIWRIKQHNYAIRTIDIHNNSVLRYSFIINKQILIWRISQHKNHIRTIDNHTSVLQYSFIIYNKIQYVFTCFFFHDNVHFQDFRYFRYFKYCSVFTIAW